MQRFNKKCFFHFCKKQKKDIVTSQNIDKIIEKKFENSYELLKEQDSVLGFKDAINKIDSPIEIDMTEENKSKMMLNPLDEKKYIRTNEKGTFRTQDGVSIKTQDENVLKILQDKNFDITKDSIKLKNKNLSSLYFSDDMTSFSLGKVKVLNKNSIDIQDVDLDNIPQDLDISLTSQNKEILVSGREIEQSDSQQKLEILDNEIYHEKTLKERINEKLNITEKIFNAQFSWEFNKILIKYLPITLFVFFYFQTLREYSKCSHSIYTVDEQRVMKLEKALSKSAIIIGKVGQLSNPYNPIITMTDYIFYKGCIQKNDGIKINNFKQSSACGAGIPDLGQKIILFTCYSSGNSNGGIQVDLDINQFQPYTGWLQWTREREQMIEQELNIRSGIQQQNIRCISNDRQQCRNGNSNSMIMQQQQQQRLISQPQQGGFSSYYFQ